MEPSRDQLEALAADLADAELVARLRRGSLTEAAAEVFRAELAARGVADDSEPAAVLTPLGPAGLPRRRLDGRAIARFIGTRILRFPVNAVRGTEAPWVVLAFGGALLAGVYKVVVYGVQKLVLVGHVPNAGLYAYLLLAVYALAALWLGVGLWRSAPRQRYRPAELVVRGLGIAVVLNCGIGGLEVARAVYHLVPAPEQGHDLMEDLPRTP